MRADAKNALFLQARKCKIRADGEGCRKGWWYDDGDEVEGSDNDEMPRKLFLISNHRKGGDL